MNKIGILSDKDRYLTLSKLNRDELLKIIMIIDSDNRKTINVMRNALDEIAAELDMCEYKGCENFSINNIHKCEAIIKCNGCGKTLCRKHALNNFFANICDKCRK